MIRTREELLNQLRETIGDSTDDNALSLLEDVTDTMTDLETRAADNTDWQSRYNQLDSEWRERYKARFFDGEPSGNEPTPPPAEDTIITTYEDLFTTE